MKTFIAAALLVTSIFATAQTPGTTSPTGVPATGSESLGGASDSVQDVEHSDGALVDPSTAPTTGTSINKQKMEDVDKKKTDSKKIDSSSNVIDHAD